MSSRTIGIVALVGVLGWGGLIWLAARMFQTEPPTAAFDLELLLRAGRDVAAGRSPYDPAIVAGAAPVAERLFYSYPPVVAQALSVVAGVPSAAMFAIWTAGAVAAFAAVAVALGRRLAPDLRPTTIALVAIAFTPLLFPFAIGLLFGNLDVFFPALYGLVVLAFVPSSPPRSALVAGAATATATVAKLHPGSLGLWLAVRAVGDRGARRAFVAALVAGGAILAVSVALAPAMWADYLAVVRAGSGADLVDPRNAGPAAQIALLVGGGSAAAESLARTLQIPVTVLALAGTALVAWRVRDPIESLAWAAAFSLVTLPVTWFHYPAALLPFAAAALLRARGAARARRVRTQVLIVAAAVVAAAAISVLPLLFAAVALVILAVRESATAPAPG